ncbi:MAG: aminopeptidase P family protein [Caldilineales bacterium]|nr:aminopeptidase P family protein [Caldilineales bacterium]
MNDLILSKVEQATRILQELDIDLWLTFVRETSAIADPVLPLIYGPADLTWQSALILSLSGERIAIVGRYDVDTARALGAYDEVIAYDQSIAPHLVQTLTRLNPRQIALNYSLDDVYADGLGYGQYLLLRNYLRSSNFTNRFVSAAPIIAALRGRKTTAEIERIRAAVAATLDIFAKTFQYLAPGQSERDIAAFMQAEVAARGLQTAWDAGDCPIVNAGPDSSVGHVAPTDRPVEPGQIVHFDFGVRRDEYCADLQRVIYMLAEGEQSAPPPVQAGFAAVMAAMDAAVAAMRPGVPGVEVDAAARRAIVDAGYPEYLYATGHQLGRNAHDGGASLAPAWERYGQTPFMLLEAGQVYAVEPGLRVPGYGYIGIEENVLVTEGGAEYLGAPQREIVMK